MRPSPTAFGYVAAAFCSWGQDVGRNGEPAPCSWRVRHWACRRAAVTPPATGQPWGASALPPGPPGLPQHPPPHRVPHSPYHPYIFRSGARETAGPQSSSLEVATHPITSRFSKQTSSKGPRLTEVPGAHPDVAVAGVGSVPAPSHNSLRPAHKASPPRCGSSHVHRLW